MKKIHYIYEYLQSPLLFTSIKVHSPFTCKSRILVMYNKMDLI